MKKKATAIITILLTIILGSLVVFCICLLGFLSHIEGYLDYCSSIKLPYIIPFLLVEVISLTLVICFCIYFELLGLVKVISKSVLRYILIALVFNLLFMTYEVIKYPILIRVISDWGNGPPSLNTLKNPLLFISILYSITIIRMTYRFLTGVNNKTIRLFIYVVSFSTILIQIIGSLTTTYEHYFG